MGSPLSLFLLSWISLLPRSSFSNLVWGIRVYGNWIIWAMPLLHFLVMDGYYRWWGYGLYALVSVWCNRCGLRVDGVSGLRQFDYSGFPFLIVLFLGWHSPAFGDYARYHVASVMDSLWKWEDWDWYPMTLTCVLCSFFGLWKMG